MVALGIMWATNTGGKGAQDAAKLTAAYHGLSKTLTDPRCINSDLDHKVNRCVQELHNGAQALEQEQEDE